MYDVLHWKPLYLYCFTLYIIYMIIYRSQITLQFPKVTFLVFSVAVFTVCEHWWQWQFYILIYKAVFTVFSYLATFSDDNDSFHIADIPFSFNSTSIFASHKSELLECSLAAFSGDNDIFHFADIQFLQYFCISQKWIACIFTRSLHLVWRQWQFSFCR